MTRAAGRLGVLALGNAVVDVLASVDDAFLTAHGIAKGGMTLIDAEAAERLYAAMPPTTASSGGSAANTMAGLAGLGASGAFIGRVGDDQLGRIFEHDIASLGVAFHGRRRASGLPTACCYILITPDAERTMNTFLGASTELSPEDVDADVVASADLLYLEGYLWDRPAAKAAMERACAQARAAGTAVALSLSDPFCVDRHGAEFRDLIDRHIDLLFANAEEITRLYQTDDVASALPMVAERVGLAAVTLGGDGAYAVSAAGQVHVPPAEPAAIVDTTGAGDQFAAGFLYGYQQGWSAEACARLGNIAAAEVIDHVGPRPYRGVAELARSAGLAL